MFWCKDHHLSFHRLVSACGSHRTATARLERGSQSVFHPHWVHGE